eukprot:Gb_05722 [translate_table: standard]
MTHMSCHNGATLAFVEPVIYKLCSVRGMLACLLKELPFVENICPLLEKLSSIREATICQSLSNVGKRWSFVRGVIIYWRHSSFVRGVTIGDVYHLLGVGALEARGYHMLYTVQCVKDLCYIMTVIGLIVVVLEFLTFFPTSRRIVQFSNGKDPGPDAQIVYIDV